MHKPPLRTSLLAGVALVFSAPALLAQVDAATRQLSHDIFKQLIEINTTDTPLGNVSTATAAMQRRFLEA